MGSFIDLTGKQFNRLTVLYDTGRKQGNEHIWHCRCQCGNECDVVGGSLRANRTKSCGCLKKETDKQPKGNVIDEVGHKYGHLTVIKRAGSTPGGIAMWECECDCGNRLIASRKTLVNGKVRRCKECRIKFLKGKGKQKHSFAGIFYTGKALPQR